jgi:hypothetical protein
MMRSGQSRAVSPRRKRRPLLCERLQLKLALVDGARGLPPFDTAEVLVGSQRHHETADVGVGVDGEEPLRRSSRSAGERDR